MVFIKHMIKNEIYTVLDYKYIQGVSQIVQKNWIIYSPLNVK